MDGRGEVFSFVAQTFRFRLSDKTLARKNVRNIVRVRVKVRGGEWKGVVDKEGTNRLFRSSRNARMRALKTSENVAKLKIPLHGEQGKWLVIF